MYGIFTYIWLIFMVNVGEYTRHGSFGIWYLYQIEVFSHIQNLFKKSALRPSGEVDQLWWKSSDKPIGSMYGTLGIS